MNEIQRKSRSKMEQKISRRLLIFIKKGNLIYLPPREEVTSLGSILCN